MSLYDWGERDPAIKRKMLPTKDIIAPLLELGLNKYEANVYLTLIAEGISTAKNISDVTAIPYGKVYEIINSLSAKGFSIVLPTKPMKYQAVSPKESMSRAKNNMHNKFENLEKQIIKELEPLFIESKKFNEPKSIFWIVNGRSNVIKKFDELIKKAEKNINIHTSANGLSRLIIHKENLEEAKNRGVNISIAGGIDKNNNDEIKTLNFCGIRKINNSENTFLSIDNKECVIVEPVPDDDDITYGRDIGIWVMSRSYTKFIDNFFEDNYKKAREMKLNGGS